MVHIQNVSIPNFSDFSIRENCDVFIREGRILSIKNSGEEPPLAEAQVISGRGKYLIPGMVNTHAHTAMTLLRGTAEDLNPLDWFNKKIWIYEQSLTPRDVYVGSQIGAAEMLLNGVTTVTDHYFDMDQAWQAFHKAGIRADLSWAVFGVGDGVDASLEAAASFVDEYAGKDSRLQVSLGPHSPYLCPDEFLSKIGDFASKEGLKIHIHAAEDERQMILSQRDRGKSPLNVLNDVGLLKKGTILAHAYWSSDEDLELIAKSGAGVAHCPKTYMRFGDFHDFLPRALERGVRLGLGSDGAASNSNMNILEAARLAALLAKGTTGKAETAGVREVLPLLFGGGSILGLDQTGAPYGTVKPGALADLVLINPNTPEMFPGNNFFADLLYGADSRNVHTVIVGGKVVVRSGKLLTLDLDSLREEALDISKRLVATKADAPMQTY